MTEIIHPSFAIVRFFFFLSVSIVTGLAFLQLLKERQSGPRMIPVRSRLRDRP